MAKVWLKVQYQACSYIKIGKKYYPLTDFEFKTYPRVQPASGGYWKKSSAPGDWNKERDFSVVFYRLYALTMFEISRKIADLRTSRLEISTHCSLRWALGINPVQRVHNTTDHLLNFTTTCMVLIFGSISVFNLACTLSLHIWDKNGEQSW